ncbi:hypothetical protein MSG28_005373 [Choristoneura fumiferana]|uniref:Uncharacterized protein n=1 Tax=Choristoneura fumiferana TaxID=7141 RepID=A0ACC0JR02_CHOFU|nr:hypothetical protein MSG28_005373 [Choristoneura fumiferana]
MAAADSCCSPVTMNATIVAGCDEPVLGNETASADSVAIAGLQADCEGELHIPRHVSIPYSLTFEVFTNTVAGCDDPVLSNETASADSVAIAGLQADCEGELHGFADTPAIEDDHQKDGQMISGNKLAAPATSSKIEMWWLFILACCVCAEKQLQRPRVYLGEEDTNSEFPYVIGIQDEYGMRICTCSLIARNWILTAGHCATFDAPTYVSLLEKGHKLPDGPLSKWWFNNLSMPKSASILSRLRTLDAKGDSMDHDGSRIKMDHASPINADSP